MGGPCQGVGSQKWWGWAVPSRVRDPWNAADGHNVWLRFPLLLRFDDFSGPAYDLTFCEVRDTSLVILWKAPVYSGSSPVSGYFVDFKEEDSGEWKTTSEAATPNRYLKVTKRLFSILFGCHGDHHCTLSPGLQSKCRKLQQRAAKRLEEVVLSSGTSS